MNRLVVITIGTIAVAAVAPALACLLGAVIPLVLVAGAVAAVLRLVWFYTRHW